ncbi:MAG: antibiotic biosynthesis monooxygenase, partial [Pseudonocardia sp.]|nr:antibiotic biosynthesis monooxygenase [Pseudonocardia sp.]
MVTEIADILVRGGSEDEFADAVRQGLTIVAGTPGFLGARLTRSVETPTRFVLLIEWETVEA